MFHTSTRSLGRTVAALTLLCLGLTAAPASATGGGGDPVPCVPKDAWTETIEHPAETHVVQHPAETHVVHHEAVTHPEYRYERSVPKTVTEYRHQYQKQVRGNVEKDGHVTGTFPFEFYTSANGWNSSGSFQWGGWGQDVTVLASGAHSSYSTTVNGERKHSTAYQYVKNGVTQSREVSGGTTVETTDWLAGPPAGDGWKQIDERVVTDQAAYDETIVDREAYEETVVDREAWTETIEHPAVTCTPEFAEYETCVLWSVDNPEVADFPQTRVDSDDCTVPPAICEGDQRFQQDYYWIRDADDEAYLAGLDHLNSPADDARLEPHNYSMIDVPAKTGEDCEPTPPTCETDPTLCPVPPVDVCPDVPGDQETLPPFVLDEYGNCVLLIPEEPVLPPNKPEKPTKPAKPSAAPPTTLLTQAPAQPAQAAQRVQSAQPAQAVLPATGAPASLWLVLLGAGLVMGGVVMTRRSNA